MAEGKNTVVVYRDWIDKFEELEDDEAGRLIKHFFRYVNDLDPEYPDKLTKIAFIDIKNSLKRDLEKWDQTLEGRSKAGKASAEARRLLKESKQDSTNSTSVDFVQQNLTNPTDSVTDIVTDSVIEKNKILNNSLLSEIKISDDKKFFLIKDLQIEAEQNEIEYFKIAEKFQKLFIKNLKEKKSPTANQEKANFKNYVSPIRLLLENKEATKEQLREAYSFLNSIEGEFWKSNILSTATLRKQIATLIAKKNIVKVLPLQNQNIPDHKKRNQL